jgi:hypothetical protein
MILLKCCISYWFKLALIYLLQVEHISHKRAQQLREPTVLQAPQLPLRCHAVQAVTALAVQMTRRIALLPSASIVLLVEAILLAFCALWTQR